LISTFHEQVSLPLGVFNQRSGLPYKAFNSSLAEGLFEGSHDNIISKILFQNSEISNLSSFVLISAFNSLKFEEGKR